MIIASGGMIMITDSMGFFLAFPLKETPTGSLHVKEIAEVVFLAVFKIVFPLFIFLNLKLVAWHP